MRMRWQEISKSNLDLDAAPGPRAGGQDGQQQLDFFQPEPRACHTNGAVDAAGVAARQRQPSPGLRKNLVTPPERRDFPWIIALGIVVVLIALIAMMYG